ncbi:hypothetical protein [Paenibacillus sp. UASWS1643]|uniref:hypothetical protein n=1 Tax=Paenibacillus sp. UASWS1643 TaxID=2580422 RepID=UPI00123A1F23|nr:hypothetical protein [Paenibacillus sp. UASWS1643]KAA8746003.1 hypothetical protein FE296_29725 [Paenibacillus sp. UASWS1643]
MQVKSIKKNRSVHDANQLFLRQMHAVLNRKLKSMRKHMAVQQLDLKQQWLKMMQEEHASNRVKSKVIYKELNVLLITPCNDREMSSHCVLIEQSLKHLVRHVNEIKYIESVSASLSAMEVDLILIVGSDESLPNENITALKASTAKKAIWLSPNQNVNQSDEMLPWLDHLFVQHSWSISDHQHHMGSTGSHELLMPPDPHIFCPQAVPPEYESDVYIIGDAELDNIQTTFAKSGLLNNKIVRVDGKGWAKLGDFYPVRRHEARQILFNGSKLVIHSGESIKNVMEIAACGTFQLIGPSVNQSNGIDLSNFQQYNSCEELTQKFEHYWQSVDARRLAASQALAYMKYNQSHLQKTLRLLDIIFT